MYNNNCFFYLPWDYCAPSSDPPPSTSVVTYTSCNFPIHIEKRFFIVSLLPGSLNIGSESRYFPVYLVVKKHCSFSCKHRQTGGVKTIATKPLQRSYCKVMSFFILNFSLFASRKNLNNSVSRW